MTSVYMNLGILCTRPSPKWLKATVTCIMVSFSFSLSAPNNNT